MKVGNAIAEILKREGVEFLVGYPVNPLFEAAAEAALDGLRDSSLWISQSVLRQAREALDKLLA